MSLLRLEDMPDEILLKIVTNLEIKDLIRCGQLCKRIRAISSDESMKRQRLSLDGMKLNYKIINKVILHNGKALTMLNLRNCIGQLISEGNFGVFKSHKVNLFYRDFCPSL